jgi:hypothetical protein
VGVIDNVRGIVGAVTDSPANIAQFIGTYMEEQGLIDHFGREEQSELQKLVIKKSGLMPENLIEAAGDLTALAANMVIGIGFGLEKWAVSNVPIVGPMIAAVQDILRIPQIAEAIAKKIIKVLFDLADDAVDKVFPKRDEKQLERWLRKIDRSRGGNQVVDNIKDRIEGILKGMPLIGPVVDKVDDAVDHIKESLDRSGQEEEDKSSHHGVSDQDIDRIASRMGGDSQTHRRRIF